MGTIPTEDYEAGNLCSVCWGAGKTFPDSDTPKRVKATFTGITNCSGVTADPNGSYILTQTSPCIFILSAGGINIIWDIHAFIGGQWKTNITMALAPYGPNFFRGSDSLCSVSIANELIAGQCALNQASGYGGQCAISWGPEI